MGAHNPFGTTFDRAGQPFVFAGNGHGIAHLTQAMIRTEHFEAHPPLWNQGRKFGGADIADNSHWLPENRGEFVAGGYLHNSVERFRLTRAGRRFRSNDWHRSSNRPTPPSESSMCALVPMAPCTSATGSIPSSATTRQASGIPTATRPADAFGACPPRVVLPCALPPWRRRPCLRSSTSCSRQNAGTVNSPPGC